MERLRLLGFSINAIETEFTGRVAILCVPQSMIERAGASERMVEGMVEYGRMIKGVEISIMLWERKPRSDETDHGQLLSRLSLRSAGRDRRRRASRPRSAAAVTARRPAPR